MEPLTQAEEDAALAAALAASLAPISAPPIDDVSLAEALSASMQPTKIACFHCRQVFGVPPRATIVECPHCLTHNRVSNEASPDLTAALQASAEDQRRIQAALAEDSIPPNAPVPSIVSRQRSRERYPAFTPVPPAAVRGVSNEAELATYEAELREQLAAEQEASSGQGDDGRGGRRRHRRQSPSRRHRDPDGPPFVVDCGPISDVSDPDNPIPPPIAPMTTAEQLGPTFNCVICMEDNMPLLTGHALQCGHRFCITCYGEHVKVKVHERNVSNAELTCPHPGCGEALAVSDVHALTWRCGDDDTWRRFEAATNEALIESLVRDGGARRCPGPTCNYAFIWSDGDERHFDCPMCRAQFCLACPCVGGGVGPAHPGMSCAEYAEQLEASEQAKRRLEDWRRENAQADSRFRELLRQELRAGNTKPCPQCKQPITKNGGCHHHTCSFCKVKFCWNCGGFNRMNPNRNTCGITCDKRERQWWSEADLGLNTPAPTAPPAATTDSGNSSLGDALRSRLMGIYRRGGSWA